MPCVLITSVGSGVGEALVDALRLEPPAPRPARPPRIVGLNTVADAAGARMADRFHPCPPTSDAEAFSRRLFEVVLMEKPDLVLAGRDADLPVLARAARALAQKGAVFPGPSPLAAEVCNDKAATARFFAAHGLPFAPTASRDDELAALVAEHPFPLIVKPRQGNASRGLRLAWGPTDLEHDPPLWGREVVQALALDEDARPTTDCLAPGGRLRQEREYSAQALVGPDGGILGTFVSKNRLAAGTPMRVETVAEPALEGALRHTALALAETGLRGPLNIQAIKTGPDAFTVFEANARFTGITATRGRMGFHEAQACLAAFGPDRPDAKDLQALLIFRPGLVSHRHLTDHISGLLPDSLPGHSTGAGAP